MPVAFQQARDDIKIMLPGEFTKILRRGAWDGFGAVHQAEPGIVVSECFRQDNQIGFLSGGIGNQGCEQAAFVSRGLSGLGLEMDGGQPDLARGGCGDFSEGNPRPFDCCCRGPAKMELNFCLLRFRGGSIDVRDFGPARRTGLLIKRKFGFSAGDCPGAVRRKRGLIVRDGIAGRILPEDSDDSCASGRRHIFGLAPREKAV